MADKKPAAIWTTSISIKNRVTDYSKEDNKSVNFQTQISFTATSQAVKTKNQNHKLSQKNIKT